MQDQIAHKKGNQLMNSLLKRQILFMKMIHYWMQLVISMLIMS